MNIEDIELEYAPLLTKQLITYMKLNYEENADYSLENLRRELIYLNDNNLLHHLALAEYVDSSTRLQQEFGG